MVLPTGSRIEYFVSAHELEHPTHVVESPLPGSSQETGSKQPILLRAKKDWKSPLTWFITDGIVPVDADTLLLDRQIIMRRSGKIIRENDSSGELHFLGNFLDDYQTPLKQAPNIDIPLSLAKVDCVILGDGRTFFVNGTRQDYTELALSLSISTRF